MEEELCVCVCVYAWKYRVGHLARLNLNVLKDWTLGCLACLIFLTLFLLTPEGQNREAPRILDLLVVLKTVFLFSI